ncbi:hypothetical protein GD416_22240 [Burkholderia sp. BE24]|nr:hypothetical protein [Burkholderia sp. BE24]
MSPSRESKLRALDELINEQDSALPSLIERTTAASHRCEILQVNWSSSCPPEYASEAVPFRICIRLTNDRLTSQNRSLS